MSNKYFDGEVNNKKVNEDVDKELMDYALNTRIRVSGAMDKLKVAEAITEIFNLSSTASGSGSGSGCISSTLAITSSKSSLANKISGCSVTKEVTLFQGKDWK